MNLAKYVVALEAQTAQYVSELKKANDQLQKFHKDQTDALDKITDGIKRLAEAYGAVRIAEFIKGQIDAGAEMVALSKRLDVTVGALSELQYAAKASNIPFESLTTTMQFMARNIAEVAKTASGGNSSAAQALSDLHLNARQLQQLPLDKQLEIITNALAGVANHTEAVNDAMQLFGRNGAVILQLAGNLGKLRAEAAAAGVVMTEEMAARAELAQRAMDLFGFKIHQAGMELGIAFGPAIQALLDQINVRFGSMGQFFDSLVTVVTAGVGLIEDAFYGWELIIGVVAQAFLDAKVKWAELVEALSTKGGGIVLSTLGTMFPTLSAALGVARSIAQNEETSSKAAKEEAEAHQKTLDALIAAGAPSEQLKENLKLMRDRAAEVATQVEFASSMRQLRADIDAWAAKMAADKPINPEDWFKDFKLANVLNKGIAPISAPPMLARPGTGAALGDMTNFATPEALAHAQFEMRRKLDEEETFTHSKELLKRQRADMDAWGQQMKGEKAVHDMKVGMAFDATNAIVGLLQVLGAKHKGFAIAALLVEKGAAIARIAISTHEAAMKAVSLTGNPAAAIPIWALGAVEMAAVGAAALAGAAQISSGGSEATLGTAANPVFTTTPAGSSSGSATQARGAVQIIFQGDVFGWDETMKSKIVDSLRDVIDNKDVIIIGQNSRQALLLGGG